MSTELVYRMRTCAAALLSRSGEAHTPFQRMYNDAADLLVEASNLIDVPEPIGEPMEMLTNTQAVTKNAPMATWGGDLPTVKAQPCPKCGSIDARSVHRAGKRLMLTCPVCSASWEYGHGA